MRTQFTLLLLSGVLVTGICLSGNGQTPTDSPSPGVFAWSPPTLEQLSEDLIRCKQDVLDAELRISHLKYLLEEVPRMDGDFDKRDRWKTELKTLEESDLPLLCSLVKYKEDDIAAFPTPTPTPGTALVIQRPSPTPAPTVTPTPTPSPRAKASPEKKLTKEEEEARKRLKEIIDRLGPLTAEINDWLKERKAKLPPVKAPDGLETDTSWQPGMLTVSFGVLSQGRIRLILPDDMRAGDTISGTVTVEPKGPTETERNQNSTALQNFAIELTMPDTTIWRVPLSTERKSFAFVMGSNPGNGTVGCTLVTRNGADVANVKVPISPAPPVTPNATTPRPANFPFASLGQTGRPLEITGAFDGSSANTKVSVGGKPANTLAESPRKCVFESPLDVTGPTEVRVNEGGREGRGAYRNIDVRLSSPKLNVSRGEKTTITVEITGLSGIRRDVPLQLEKTGTVTMERGDVQHIQIHPADVRADGTFELKRTLTGLQAGAFGVTATVIDPARRPVIIPLTENAKVNGFRVRKDGDKFVIEVDGAQSPITGKPLDGEHKLEHQCPTLSKVPYLNSLFLNKGAGRSTANCLMLMVTPRIIIQDDQ